MKTADEIVDLRSALEFLASIPGQLISTKEPVDAVAELAGVYRHVGAGTPVAPPTRIGPAMLFESVKGYDIPVVTGILASRERTALLLNSSIERLPFDLLEALKHPLPPVMVREAPCQEVVIRPPFDLRRLIPAPTNTLQDAGPYFNMGLMRAEDPETGESDVTIHRLCVQGPDRLSVYFVPGRHIDQFRIKAEKMGRALPVSISMGLDPAIYLAACFEPPTTPLGFDELTIAGGLRRRPVELVECVSVAAKAIARAEIVLEGEILPGERIREDVQTNTGYCMPEFPGYLGRAQAALPVIRVKAVTHRRNPILQTIVGPGEEHVNLAGIPTEASILRLVEDAMPGRLRNVYCHSAGRREVPRDPAIPQGSGERRGAAAAGRADGVRGVSGTEARHPGGRGRGHLRHQRRAVGDDDALPGRREHGVHSGSALPPARSVAIAGVQPVDPGGGGILQDDLRLHGAVPDEGTVPAGGVCGRRPEEVYGVTGLPSESDWTMASRLLRLISSGA